MAVIRIGARDPLPTDRDLELRLVVLRVPVGQVGEARPVGRPARRPELALALGDRPLAVRPVDVEDHEAPAQLVRGLVDRLEDHGDPSPVRRELRLVDLDQARNVVEVHRRRSTRGWRAPK